MEAQTKAKEEAWVKTSEELRNYLDINEIYPYLLPHLMNHEAEILRSNYRSRNEKVDSLMAWIPTKGGSWFEDFGDILDKTKRATGHADIIGALQRNLDEVYHQNGIPLIIVAGKS